VQYDIFILFCHGCGISLDRFCASFFMLSILHARLELRVWREVGFDEIFCNQYAMVKAKAMAEFTQSSLRHSFIHPFITLSINAKQLRSIYTLISLTHTRNPLST